MSLAMGVMIEMLFGGGQPSEKYLGRKIVDAQFSNDTLTIRFEDGTIIDITDHGQSCCEHRYAVCDDDPSVLIGGALTAITTTSAPDEPDEYGDHEVAFLKVHTDRAGITIATHNEHNGFYGGFALEITEREP